MASVHYNLQQSLTHKVFLGLLIMQSPCSTTRPLPSLRHLAYPSLSALLQVPVYRDEGFRPFTDAMRFLILSSDNTKNNSIYVALPRLAMHINKSPRACPVSESHTPHLTYNNVQIIIST